MLPYGGLVAGKRGLTPVILSQRFAETNNKIIAQSEIRFILRQTQDNDLDRCKKYVRAEHQLHQQEIRQLAGAAWHEQDLVFCQKNGSDS